MNLLYHPHASILHLTPNMTTTPQKRTLIPRPGRSPTTPLQRPRRPSTLFDIRRRTIPRTQTLAPFRREGIEESGGGGHAAGEDRGGEFACGPEGWGLEVESFVRVARVEGDDEAHDGGGAGAAGG
ncbi:MAG: hypothetical protein Q9175_002667 [Cornicularia normoerica]